ncbi:MAG: hypothetical protein LW857_07270 [Verrucomicrobiae bacterium]|jgi:hypothetical protein|nr:hypothetical protein [Verrucomicrobiae bacterium]
MKALTFILASATLVTTAAGLPEKEALLVVAQATAYREAAAKGDADKFLEWTHPALYTLFGGKEPFEAATRLALKSLAGKNVIEKITFGVPAELHVAGQEEICFVPFVQIASAGDIRTRAESYFIAVRPVGKADWKFIDAAGLRKHPEVLRQLFPGLPEKVVTPPNKVEIVK